MDWRAAVLCSRRWIRLGIPKSAIRNPQFAIHFTFKTCDPVTPGVWKAFALPGPLVLNRELNCDESVCTADRHPPGQGRCGSCTLARVASSHFATTSQSRGMGDDPLG